MIDLKFKVVHTSMRIFRVSKVRKQRGVLVHLAVIVLLMASDKSREVNVLFFKETFHCLELMNIAIEI